MKKSILVAGLFALAIPVCLNTSPASAQSATAGKTAAPAAKTAPSAAPAEEVKGGAGKGEKYTQAYDACYEEAESKANGGNEENWSDFFNQCMKNKGFEPEKADENIDDEEGAVQ